MEKYDTHDNMIANLANPNIGAGEKTRGSFARLLDSAVNGINTALNYNRPNTMSGSVAAFNDKYRPKSYAEKEYERTEPLRTKALGLDVEAKGINLADKEAQIKKQKVIDDMAAKAEYDREKWHETLSNLSQAEQPQATKKAEMPMPYNVPQHPILKK